MEKARKAEARRMVEQRERELEILDRRRADINARDREDYHPGRQHTEPTEEDYYLVFKKSIDGSYPNSGQFRGDVEATYSTT